MQKFIIIIFCAWAVALVYGAYNIPSIHAQFASYRLVYNSKTQNFYFSCSTTIECEGQTRYANQPLEKKMLALQTIEAN